MKREDEESEEREFKDQIREGLRGLSQEELTIFTVRCAWRAVPGLMAVGGSWWECHGNGIQASLVAPFSLIYSSELRPQIDRIAAAAYIAAYTSAYTAHSDASTTYAFSDVDTSHSAVYGAAAAAAATAVTAVTAVTAAVSASAAAAAAESSLMVYSWLRVIGTEWRFLDGDGLDPVRAAILSDLTSVSEHGRNLLNRPLWSGEAWKDGWSEKWRYAVAHNSSLRGDFDLLLRWLMAFVEWKPQVQEMANWFNDWWSRHPENPDGSSSTQPSADSPDFDKPLESASSLPEKQEPPRNIHYEAEVTNHILGDTESPELTESAKMCAFALHAFLTSPGTKPPITVSIEAPWGCGKSSVMRFLRRLLEKEEVPPEERGGTGAGDAIPTIWFNPWKHEAGKTLWAAFAVAFERQLMDRAPHAKTKKTWHVTRWFRRQGLRMMLSWLRLTGGEKVVLGFRLALWFCLAPVAYWFFGQIHSFASLPNESAAKDAPTATLVLTPPPTLAEKTGLVPVIGEASPELSAEPVDPTPPVSVSSAPPSIAETPADGVPPSEKEKAASGSPKDSFVKWIVGQLPWLGVLLWGWALVQDLMKQFGSPLKIDVVRLFSNQPHRDSVDDLHRFQEDFRRLLKTYVPRRRDATQRRVAVFIDDLDRCESTKAAEVLQSLFQMLHIVEDTSDDALPEIDRVPGVYCIIGMDRDKVAASVAAMHEKMLPMLLRTCEDKDTLRERSIDFGHAYLEKFIQLTLQLPSLQGRDCEFFLRKVTGWDGKGTLVSRKVGIDGPGTETVPQNETAGDTAVQKEAGARIAAGGTDDMAVMKAAIKAAVEAEEKASKRRIDAVNEVLQDGQAVHDAAYRMREALDWNPRKLKQFINLYRLRLYLAAALKQLDVHTLDPTATEVAEGKLSAHHIATLVALEIACPRAMAAFRADPGEDLLESLRKAVDDADPAVKRLVDGTDEEGAMHDLRKAPLADYFQFDKR